MGGFDKGCRLFSGVDQSGILTVSRSVPNRIKAPKIFFGDTPHSWLTCSVLTTKTCRPLWLGRSKWTFAVVASMTLRIRQLSIVPKVRGGSPFVGKSTNRYRLFSGQDLSGILPNRQGFDQSGNLTVPSSLPNRIKAPKGAFYYPVCRFASPAALIAKSIPRTLLMSLSMLCMAFP